MTAARTVPPVVRIDRNERRSLLLPFEGQTVLVSGTVSAVSDRGEGGHYICIVDVEVRPNDPTVPLLSIKPTKLHHAWQAFPQGAKILPPGTGAINCGRVGWYVRSDGTPNLGITPGGLVDMVSVLEKAGTMPQSVEARLAWYHRVWLPCLDAVREARERNRLYLVSDCDSLDSALELIVQRLEREKATMDREWQSRVSGWGHSPEKRARRRLKSKPAPGFG